MKPNIKKAIESAEKELEQEKQNKIKEEVKNIIKAILEKTEKAQEKRQEAVKEIQIHKKMLDYLKKGDLEKIKEMLETDEFAKKIAVIIIKEKEIIREKEFPAPFPYDPYPWNKWEITWNKIYSSSNSEIMSDSLSLNCNGSSTINTMNTMNNNTCCAFSGKEFKDFTSGSYQCLSGKVYHLGQ